jgi:hypothetical protein
MTEQELRALVRDAVARHLGGQSAAGQPETATLAVRQHASHALFLVPSGADTDGPCIIEPAVTCNHCGFCKS